MNLNQIKKVMKKYGEAWENQDSELILECFTENGLYQESPSARPHQGHKEIKEFWDRVVKQKTTDIKFTLGRCYVSEDGEIGFAEWECKNIYKKEKHHMFGIMILKMKGDKISFLNEYWNTEKGEFYP